MTRTHAGQTGLVLRSGLPMPVQTTAELMIDAIDAGLAPGFVTEVSGLAGTVLTAAVAARRPAATLGTGIVPLGSRSAATLAMEAATVAGLCEHPFLLGVGVSSPRIMEDWHQASYTPTVATTRTRLQQLRALLDGEQQGSFSLVAPPGSKVQLLLGALGPRMLELAFEVADGAIVNLTPTSAIEAPPQGVVLYASVWVQACDDGEARARREIASYAMVPSYARHLERLGYGSVVSHIRSLYDSGRLPEAPAMLPDELVDALYVDCDDLAARLAAYRAAGATPIVVPVTGDDPATGIGELVDRLSAPQATTST